MAVTTLSATSSRYGADVYLTGASAAVPLDAQVTEYFILPVPFGDIILKAVRLSISGLSGAYVAVAPAFDGFLAAIVSGPSGGLTIADILGAPRFTVTGTSSGRPILEAALDFNSGVLFRQIEGIAVTAPIIAGAGVTGTVSCGVRGHRLKTT